MSFSDGFFKGRVTSGNSTLGTRLIQYLLSNNDGKYRNILTIYKKKFLDVNETTLTYVDVLENWEIAPGDLVLLDTKLGEGQFGIVRQGLLTTGKGDSEVVAVKTLKGTELFLLKGTEL